MFPRLSAASLAPPSVAEVLVGVGVGAPCPLVGGVVGVPLVGVGVGVGSLVVLVPLGASILTVSIPGGLCWGISRSGLFFWGLVGHSGSFTNSLGVGLVCGCGVLVGGGLGFPLAGIPLLGLGFLFGFTIVDDVVDCIVVGLVILGVEMHIWFDSETGIVQQLRLIPPGARFRDGPRRILLELVDQEALPTDFFSHPYHHEPERPVKTEWSRGDR